MKEEHFPHKSEINYGTQRPEHAGKISPIDGSKAVLFREEFSSKAVKNQTSDMTGKPQPIYQETLGPHLCCTEHVNLLLFTFAKFSCKFYSWKIRSMEI